MDPVAVLSVLVRAQGVGAVNAQLAGVQAMMVKTGQTSTGMNAAIAKSAKYGAAALGVGLAYGLAKSAQKSAQFEKKLDDLQAVSGGTAKQMKMMKKEALEMGRTTKFSAMDVADAQVNLVKGGLAVKQVIGGALPAALALAAAGDMDLAEAGRTVVNSMGLFSLSGRDSVKVADMLAVAANKTTADVNDFAFALRQGGSAAMVAGYSMNEAVTVLEALAKAGIRNADAGTSMKAAFIQLLSPSEQQRKMQNKLNLEFITQNGELKNGIQISKMLRKELGDKTKAQRADYLSVLAGTDGFRTLSSLYAAGPKKLRALSKANTEQGTAAEIAAKKVDNLSGDTTKLMNSIEAAAIVVGDVFNPILRKAVQGITDFVNSTEPAVKAVKKIFDDKNLTGAEKFGKIMDLITKAVLKGIGNLTKAVVKAAPDIAVAFAEGFVAAPIWMQLAGVGLFLKMFGGPAGIATAGASIGTKFGAAFGARFAATQAWGGTFTQSMMAGMSGVGTAGAKSMMSSMAKTIGPLVAVFAIGDIIATAVSGDMESALTKTGGALVGAGIGFAVGGPIGAAIGSGIGSGLSGVVGGIISDVFSSGESEGGPVKILSGMKQIENAAKSASKARVAGNEVVIQTSKRLAALQDRVAGANRRVKNAEDALAAARQKYGQNSIPAIRAEKRLGDEKARTLRLTNRLKNADRLHGQVREAQKKITAVEIVKTRNLVAAKRADLKEDMAIVRKLNEKGAGYKRLKPAVENLNKSSKEFNRAQAKSNNVLAVAEKEIGPKWVRQIRAMSNEQIINIARSKLGRKAHELAAKAVGGNTTANKRLVRQLTAGGPRGQAAVEALADKITDFSKSGKRNWRGLSNVQQSSTAAMETDTREAIDVIKGMGNPQKKRRGGFIGARQRFKGGGVPVAMSPGEAFKTPSGNWGVVPGRPEARDSFLTTLPVDTKVFTFDGQAKLASGASESQALSTQRPHFAKGGIVKPTITGGTQAGQDVANTSVGEVYKVAKEVIKEARKAAAAAAAGAGNFNYTGPPADMKKLGDNAWVDTHTLAVGDYMAKRFNTSITDGWRPQDAGYGATNSSHKRGTPSNPGALDFAAATSEFQAFAGAHIAGLTENLLNDAYSTGPHNHLAFFRRGGAAEHRVVNNVGAYLLSNGFDFRATAGILGNAWREGLWNPKQLEYGNSSNGGLYGFTTPPVSLANMISWAESAGKNPWDEITQTKFMLTHGDPPGMQLRGKLNANETIAESAADFMNGWERPASSTAGLDERVAAGHDAANIMQDRGIISASKAAQYLEKKGLPSGGMTGPGEMSDEEKEALARKRRLGWRTDQISKMREKVKEAKTVRGRTAAYWRLLQTYAKYSQLGEKGRKFVLNKVRKVASEPNPNRKVGPLSEIAQFWGKHGQVTGKDTDDYKELSKAFERARDKGDDIRKVKRKKISNRITSKGLDFPGKKSLQRLARRNSIAEELIERMEAIHSAPGSAPGGDMGTELTDKEVFKQIEANIDLYNDMEYQGREAVGSKKWIKKYIRNMDKKIKLATPKTSKDHWKLKDMREGRANARTSLGEVNTTLDDIYGVSRKKGKLFDLKMKLNDLGYVKTWEKSNAESFNDEKQANLEELLKTANMRSIVLERQFGALNSLPPWMGAYANGGIAMVGERGPELAHLPSGTRVHGANETQRMLAGGAGEVKIERMSVTIYEDEDKAIVKMDDQEFEARLERANRKKSRGVGAVPGRGGYYR